MVQTFPENGWYELGNCDGPFNGGNYTSCFRKCGCNNFLITPCTDAQSSPWCNCSSGTPPGTANQYYQKNFIYESNFTMGEGNNSLTMNHYFKIEMVRGFLPPKCPRIFGQIITYVISDGKKLTGCINVNENLNGSFTNMVDYFTVQEDFSVDNNLIVPFSSGSF